eukprot:15264007-Ditylum_brightwellii.AAC.1
MDDMKSYDLDQTGDFVRVMIRGNSALGQAVIQLAAIGGAGGIHATSWKENACIVTELSTHSVLGATRPTGSVAPNKEIVHLCIDIL